jgi:cytochrome c oxidase subunit 1
MQRRVPDYWSPFATLNAVSSAGAFLLGLSTLVFIYNVYWTARNSPKIMADDPWGYGNSLEWATSSPPPRHNFQEIPRIRSDRPAFDLHYPHTPLPAGGETPHGAPGEG